MSASLVGSEMCIRDSPSTPANMPPLARTKSMWRGGPGHPSLPVDRAKWHAAPKGCTPGRHWHKPRRQGQPTHPVLGDPR
eukprot:13965126-Alexandrium_andersonii.AAC.1